MNLEKDSLSSAAEMKVTRGVLEELFERRHFYNAEFRLEGKYVKQS